MVGRASLVVLLAVFLGVASAANCGESFECANKILIGDEKLQSFQLMDGGVEVGEVDIRPNPNKMKFNFTASNGYEIVGVKGGMWEDCSSVPNGSSKWQFQVSSDPQEQINKNVGYSEVTAPAEGCCDRSWCFVFQAKIQKFGEPSTAKVYRPRVTDPGCTRTSEGFPVCAAALTCEGCTFCRDDQSGSAVDEGCDAEKPYCDTGDGRNNGDGKLGKICRTCLGRGQLAKVDNNCTEEFPDCVDFDGNEVLWGRLGDECTCLLDSAACETNGQAFDASICECVPCIGGDDIAVPDRGCSAAKPTCVDDTDTPVGSGEIGEECICPLGTAASSSCFPLSLDEANCECTPCVDAYADGTNDTGCDTSLPYCDAGSGLNAGDGETGEYCRFCAANADEIDYGCSEATPTCVTDDAAAVPLGDGLLGDQCVCLTTCDDDLMPDLNEDTCSCECLNPCSSFTQVGQDLDGNFADSYGNAVELSADGSRMIVGAYRAGGGDRGQAYLFELQSGMWVQRGATIEGDSSYDRMGWSADIAADGVRIAVGATQNDGAIRNGGVVRVYDLDDDTDTLVQVGGDIEGVVQDELSGSSVALSDDGTTVAIGATNNDSAGFLTGQVRVFTYDSIEDAWTQVGSNIDGDRAGDRMGNSVGLSADGTILAVGTHKGLNSNRQDSGLVKVYELVSGEWVQLGSTIYGYGTEASFGFNLAISADGSILASGSSGWGSGGIMQVYQFSTTDGDWVQLGEDISSEAGKDSFGIDVDLTPDGHTMAIGGNRNDGNGSNSGYVQIYDLVNDDWVQVGEDIDGENNDDLSGGQVSISADGSRVAIGAQAALIGDTTNRGGNVRVFDENLICCSV